MVSHEGMHSAKWVISHYVLPRKVTSEKNRTSHWHDRSPSYVQFPHAPDTRNREVKNLKNTAGAAAPGWISQ